MDKTIDPLVPPGLNFDRDDCGPSINEVHQQYLKLQDQFGARSSVDGVDFTPYEVCLHRLVDLLEWRGDERQLMEALPHLEPIQNIGVLQTVLSNIGFQSIRKKVRALASSSIKYPCVLDFADGPVIITERLGRRTFKGVDKNGVCEIKWGRVLKADCLVLFQSRDDFLGDVEAKKGSWFFDRLKQLRRPIHAALFLTCIANILTLATPLYTMNVYNRVIGGQALDTLAYLFLGICLIIGFEILVRRKRGAILSFIGARMDAEITNKAFQQVLTLPVVMTENASLNRQIVQFKQFESIRDLLTGNLASTLLDLPFLVIFFAVIVALAGWLVIIPIALLALFGVLAFLTLPTVRSRAKKSGHDRTQFNRMSMELATKMQAVRELGLERLWLARHVRVAQIAAYSTFRSRFFETALQSAAQILVMMAGLATIAIGAYQVIVGEMDTGALIAIMMIVWRILTPIQVAFLALNRIGQLKQTVKQLDRLMSIDGERRFKGRPHSLRQFAGTIKFDGVSFRYGPKAEPVLKGVGFEAKHGELIAIMGATGSGKSTLLKILLGFYKPQAGRVFVDDINIQQLDVGELRSSIGFMPQDVSVFYGTLAQNLLLGNPLASRDQMLEALTMAGVLPGDPLLEGGLDRPLRYEKGDLSTNDIARIALARAYLAEGNILLLDNPGAHFDFDTDKYFIDHLQQLKQKKTVLLVTNRPSHIKSCDRIFQMHNGMLVNELSPEEYKKALEAQAPMKAS